ncbi:MAG TPA: hypothetical protein VIL18_13345 [Longimicrobiales bacterium]
MSALALAALELRARRRRVLALLAFAGVFLAAALTARLMVSRGEGGHVEMDRLFEVGGYPLVSALLLLGWILGRYPLVATLVMLAGVASHDRVEGYARLYAVRPTSPHRIYAARAALLAAAAFVISAALLPVFDLIMLGTWAGPATFVLILAYVIVYGGMVALLSVWTRGDAWIALLLALLSLVWDALLRADALAIPPGVRDVITFVLPPQAAFLELEGAFGALQPIPWDAFAYVAGYGVVLWLLAAASLGRREV